MTRSRAWLVALLVVLLLGGVALWWRPWQHPADPASARSTAPDPRRTYIGPYRNVSPDVAFVGDAACQECHADVCGHYAKHPMGRSIFPVAAAVLPDLTKHNPFTVGSVQYAAVQQDGRFLHRETVQPPGQQPVYQTVQEAKYVIGSGTHGHSYLGETDDGFVFQTPISWFSQKGIWDLSPTFVPGANGGRREILPACLYCHANAVEPVADTQNRYQPPVFRGHSIGCERCHGPGGLHVKDPVVPGSLNTTIVNPKHLEPRLREAVCQQCHLAGAVRVLRRGRELFDYRPGLPLESVWAVFSQAREGTRDDRKAVNHVEQMAQSKCFTGSAGPNQLGCASCHDPHVKPTPDVAAAFYRNRCLTCHNQKGCPVPEPQRRAKVADDNCATCHMAKAATSDVAHTATTSHRIAKPGSPAPPLPSGAGLPVIPFHFQKFDQSDDELARDLGVALAQMAVLGQLDVRRHGDMSHRQLEQATARDPDDVPAWEAKAQILVLLGKRPEAKAAVEELLQRRPGHEIGLGLAGGLAFDRRDYPAAKGFFERAIAANPWQPTYRRSLVKVLTESKAWPEVTAAARDWVRLDPGNDEARQALTEALARTGQKAEAKAELTKLLLLRPERKQLLEAWYRREFGEE